MKVMKRDGTEVPFDREKISRAIEKACQSEPDLWHVPGQMEVVVITTETEGRCRLLGRVVGVEEIQDMVEDALIDHGYPKLMQKYKNYRTKRQLMRQGNTTDGKILSIVACTNEEADQENANKNPTVNSTQRDYIAGETSRDISRRLLLPEDIVEAHDEGVIHNHK